MERFCEEYLVDMNGTQAAIRAGYSKKTANEQAARLLTKVSIRARIEAGKQSRSERTQIDQNYVVYGLREVAERCLQRVPVMVFNKAERCMEQATDEDGKGIWQFDSSGANRALELLGKHTGVFEKDNVQKSPNITIIDSYNPGGDGGQPRNNNDPA